MYRFAFQGQERDREPNTEHEFFQLRTWDGRLGRWTSVDPYNQYHSTYLGMGNNPISMVDPDGGYASGGGWLSNLNSWAGDLFGHGKLLFATSGTVGHIDLTGLGSSIGNLVSSPSFTAGTIEGMAASLKQKKFKPADLGSDDVLNEVKRSLRYAKRKRSNDEDVTQDELFDFTNASKKFRKKGSWALGGKVWEGDFGNVHITLSDLGDQEIDEIREYFPGNEDGKRYGPQKKAKLANPLTGKRLKYPLWLRIRGIHSTSGKEIDLGIIRFKDVKTYKEWRSYIFN